MDLSFSDNAFYHICPRVEMNSHGSAFRRKGFFSFICPNEDRGNTQCGKFVCPVCNGDPFGPFPFVIFFNEKCCTKFHILKASFINLIS